MGPAGEAHLLPPSGEPERVQAPAAPWSTQRRVLFLSRSMVHRRQTFGPPSLFAAMTDGLICFSSGGRHKHLDSGN